MLEDLEHINDTLIAPNQADIYNIAAQNFYNKGEFEEALNYLQQSLTLAPNSYATHHHCALTFKALGNINHALEHFDEAIALSPDYFEALHHKGLLLYEQKSLAQALNCFNQALKLKPDDEDALVSCGNTLYEMEQYEFALAHYDFALKINACCLAALNGRAVALYCLKQYEQGLEACNLALFISPDLIEALLNRGSILNSLGRQQEAIKDYQQILTLNLQSTLAYCNLANLYLDMQEIEASRESYLKALATAPDNPTVHWNLALFYLLTGEYEQGWQFYESGRYAPNFPRGLRESCPQPMWLGETPIKGKRILLYAEQGFGDAIQFARYANMVAKQGATVILELPKTLHALIQTMSPAFQLIERDITFTDFDYHCSLMSLPLAFKTSVENIPDDVPYLFADHNKIGIFQAKPDNRIRVGIAWSGSSAHNDDANRSIALEKMLPLFQLDASFHCLQKEIRESDKQTLTMLPELHIYTEQLDNFSDTAALIASMDLVISVDTSVAHLAGAMDKPVWVLLPNPPDFRWMLEREDSPWYPSAVLFRRSKSASWDNVIAKVSNELKKVINRKYPTYD